MAHEFENQLVHAFNNFFNKKGMTGIAYRLKQAKFTSQNLDVLVDGVPIHDDQGDTYFGIECKSMKTDSSNKLYFSSHFSEADGVHQVENISQFLEDSNRTGFLAVELRRGRGKPRQAYLIHWNWVKKYYEDGEPGLSLTDIKNGYQLPRNGSDYEFEIDFFTELCT